MSEFSNRSGWTLVLVALVGALIGGVIAYNIGLSHAAGAAALPPGPYPYPYVWHRPWGFGFGFPFLFILLLLFLFRGICWGGPWRRRYWYDYHERERMKEGSPANDPNRG